MMMDGLSCEICGQSRTRKNRPFRSVHELADHLKRHHPDQAEAAEKRARIKERHAHAYEEALRKRKDRESLEGIKRRSATIITLTGDEVDEIIDEITGLVGMMEPYYSQGNCADSSSILIDRLEAKIKSAMKETK